MNTARIQALSEALCLAFRTADMPVPEALGGRHGVAGTAQDSRQPRPEGTEWTPPALHVVR